MPLVIPLFISHRGCPHTCLFCNQERIAGADAVDSGAGIAATIATWLARSPSRRQQAEVAFYGGSFTCLPETEQEELLAGVAPALRAGEVGAIRLSTRPDCLDPARCRWLRERGVGMVELGVQSLDDGVLATARRGHSAEQSREAVAMLRAAGLAVGVQLLPGLPGESSRSFLRGIGEVIALRPEVVRLYPVLVLAGTGLARLHNQGRYRPLSLARAVVLVATGYQRLTAAGIRVVRMGLQPTPALAAALVAGPFHPAFGELVLARLWLRRLRARLALLRPGETLRVHVSHRDRSALAGMGGGNIRRLTELGYGGRLQIFSDRNMLRGTIRYVVG
jgi:histone acetyltransferase (RNA polymerase elongator complex component)